MSTLPVSRFLPNTSQRSRDQPIVAIFVTGDSTSGLNPPSKKTGDKVSWSDVFSKHLQEPNAKYYNRSVPGFSLRDYFHRSALDSLLVEAKAGDILLACHGHLERTPLIRDNQRARGSLPGAGDETKTVFDPVFKREEVIHTFGWYLKKYHERSLEKGLITIFLSPPVRNVWENAIIKRTASTAYASVMKQVCESIGANFLDFAAITEIYLQGLGQSSASSLYMNDDNTHTNITGAEAYAKLLAASLLENFDGICRGRIKREIC